MHWHMWASACHGQKIDAMESICMRGNPLLKQKIDY